MSPDGGGRRLDEREILSLDAFDRNRGIGSTLVQALLAAQAVQTTVVVVTTNDSLAALGFYQKLGFALTAIRSHAVTEARRHKPSIPSSVTAAFQWPHSESSRTPSSDRWTRPFMDDGGPARSSAQRRIHEARPEHSGSVELTSSTQKCWGDWRSRSWAIASVDRRGQHASVTLLAGRQRGAKGRAE